MYPKIQHLVLRLTGFFDYQITRDNIKIIEDKFDYNKYFEDNALYFNQKYYHNWLKTLYPRNEKLTEMGIPFLKGNHLTFKQAGSISSQAITVKSKVYQFRINSIDTYLFRENLAIFSIDISPDNQDWNFNDISDFSNAARHTSGTPIIDIIYQYVLNIFSLDTKHWHTYNPNLKLFLNIDVTENFSEPLQIDHLLFELATVSPMGSSSSWHLYNPSDYYFSKIMKDNTIHIFNNWKTICVTDSLVRISIDLKNFDGRNLWENDYYSIYVFTLFIRFYLYRTNSLLAETVNLKKSTATRNAYINFMNDFDLTQISYKFLPNEIYKKLLSSLEVSEELNKLDQKISRVDKSINEFQQKRVEMFIRYLLVITLFPISWEGSELINLFFFHHDDHIAQRIIAIFLFLSLIVVGLLFYYIIGKKETGFLKKK
jgi:hypothetical protein